jgi:hypothetical protein
MARVDALGGLLRARAHAAPLGAAAAWGLTATVVCAAENIEGYEIRNAISSNDPQDWSEEFQSASVTCSDGKYALTTEALSAPTRADERPSAGSGPGGRRQAPLSGTSRTRPPNSGGLCWPGWSARRPSSSKPAGGWSPSCSLGKCRGRAGSPEVVRSFLVFRAGQIVPRLVHLSHQTDQIFDGLARCSTGPFRAIPHPAAVTTAGSGD